MQQQSTSLRQASAPNCASQGPIGRRAAAYTRGRNEPATSSSPIQHVVIIVQENRSFDDLFQGYPCADTSPTGLNSKGQTIRLAPVPLEAQYDILHFEKAWITGWDNGKMDGFDLVQAGGPQIKQYPNPQYGYVPHSEIGPYLTMAQRYVLGDQMFSSAIDGSMIAHQYLIAAQANREVDFPSGLTSCKGGPDDTIHQLTQQRMITQGTVPWCDDYETLGDELDAKGISWRMYAPGPSESGVEWKAYAKIKHIYFGSDWKTDIISPETKFLTDIQAGTLAGVTWIIPDLQNSDHAMSQSATGPAWVASLVNAVGQSSFWNSSVIFIVWDDWGGWYDHVPPPQLDFDGLGFRVPYMCISPYAYRGVVSHTQYEFGSILRYTEDNFGVPQMAASDARATSALVGCLDYSQHPRRFVSIPSTLKARDFIHDRPSRLPPDDD